MISKLICFDGKAGKRQKGCMKTTIDFPDPLFRQVKATAAAEGLSLKSFITEAVVRRLQAGTRSRAADFASLPRISEEVLNVVRERVEQSDAADLAFQQTQGL